MGLWQNNDIWRTWDASFYNWFWELINVILLKKLNWSPFVTFVLKKIQKLQQWRMRDLNTNSSYKREHDML